MVAEMAQEVKGALAGEGLVAKEGVMYEELAGLCGAFGKTPQAMARSLVAFALSTAQNVREPISPEQLDAFRIHLTSTANVKKRRRTQEEEEYYGNLDDFFDDADGDYDFDFPIGTSGAAVAKALAAAAPPTSAPSAAAPAATLAPPPGGSAFSKRSQRMAATCAMGASLPEVEPEELGGAPAAVELLTPREGGPARYMYERLEDKVGAIESRLLAFAEALGEAMGEESYPADPVAAAAGGQVRCVGRVVAEGDGRLVEGAAMLEGSVRHSGGGRAGLRLGALPSYALFPGQAVAAEGLNPAGFALTAHRLVTGLPPPPYAPPPELEGAACAPCSVVCAAGPFSCASDLAYEPLKELLEYTRRRRPDALFLLGPFVDAESPAVRGGALDCSFEAVFASAVRDPLERLLAEEGCRTRVVLVPSTRDAAHCARVFPQPPLPEGLVEAAEGQVTMAPNPCVVRVGGAAVGATTADVLRALSAAESARDAQGAPKGDRMARLAGHLLGQRSWYPLHPPAPGARLDASRAEGLRMEAAPDVLLLPSDLGAFAKAVPLAPTCTAAKEGEDVKEEGGEAKPAAAGGLARSHGASVAVNPGRLAKGSMGGTFAHLHVHPPREAEEAGGEGGAAAAATFASRARVDLVRV